jgi:SAM-dependent methyltransferase
MTTSHDAASGSTADRDLQLRTLEALESARNYNTWITSLILPHLGDDPVEIGSGMGYQTELLLLAGLPRVTVSEHRSEAVTALRTRFAGDARVDYRVIDFTAPPVGEHSAAYAVNVLEHVEDDVRALTGAAGLVRGGGRVIVFVPAFPFAMSRFDRELGHFRRYTQKTLRTTFLAAGLQPDIVRYVNAPGLPVWFVWMRLLGQRPKEGLALTMWDRLVVPVTRAVEQRAEPPFGQSVLAVARV